MDEPVVLLNESRENLTLREWMQAANKVCIIDFWNARCTRCPAALTKLNHMANQHATAFWGACALAVTIESSPDESADLIADAYESLNHAYMPYDSKERLKDELGFTTLPFCVICATDGNVLWKGDPRDDSFHQIVAEIIRNP